MANVRSNSSVLPSVDRYVSGTRDETIDSGDYAQSRSRAAGTMPAFAIIYSVEKVSD